MASRKEGSASASGKGKGKGKGKGGSRDSAMKQVQIDVLVVLKIIKHYQEGQRTEHTEYDADFDEVQCQMEMMQSLCHVNTDHLHVGWYQSTFYGSFITWVLLDSQFSYQHAIEESVVLIYDAIKTAQGSLSLKAYKLTPKLMEVYKEKEFSPEALKKAVSPLSTCLKKFSLADKHEFFSLASSNHLGKNLQLLMDRVDKMRQDIVKYNTYMRSISKQQQQKHQYQQHHQQETIQMDSLLIARQINTYCQNIKEFTAQNLGKLFMA
uniref:Eukaryotic translation initiation factor 3 subunit H n=1 Tax=Cebus imitator TaxID=2715852 RepID=A0A2K5RT50_CEBIM